MKLTHVPKALLAALVCSIAFWLNDFPKPYWDDLFYTGAGINLAQGGDLSNSLLAREGWPSHYFLVYPPLQSYVLAGWLKIFGISARSVTALPILCFGAICCAGILLLRRNGAKRYMEWLVVPGALFAVLPLGLRPEPLAIAFVMCGILLADWRRKPGASLCVGVFLIYLGASAAPRVTVFAIALAAYSAWACWKESAAEPQKRIQVCLTHAGAIALTGILFLVMIDFRVHEFWQMFHLHSSRVANKQIHLLVGFALFTLRVLQWPLVLLPIFLVLPVLKRPLNDLGRLGLCIMAALPLTVFIGGVGVGTLWWTIMAMLLLAASLIAVIQRPRQLVIFGMVALSLAVADRRILLEFAGLLTGRISSDPGEHFQEARAMKPTEEHPLLVDSATARYVYDYKIPKGCLDGVFATPFPGGVPGDLSSSELLPGDIFMAGTDVVRVLLDRTYLQEDVPIWHAFGFKKLSFPQTPRHIYIFATTECKGPHGKRPFE